MTLLFLDVFEFLELGLEFLLLQIELGFKCLVFGTLGFFKILELFNGFKITLRFGSEFRSILFKFLVAGHEFFVFGFDHYDICFHLVDFFLHCEVLGFQACDLCFRVIKLCFKIEMFFLQLLCVYQGLISIQVN